MRRIALLAVAVAALACSSAASTALQPIRRPHSRETAPRLLNAPLRIPREHFRGRVRVIARLDLPPLAAAYTEDLAIGGSTRRLDLSAGSSRRYLARPVVNLGVSVVSTSNGAVIDPWLLGSLDENDVQGEAGTPIDVNPLTFDFGLAIGSAATVFPRLKRYYVSVDSPQDVFTHKPLSGRYRLRYWVNDLRPPRIRLLTRRIAAGRPTLAIRVQDSGAGVDPFSLLMGYRTKVIGGTAYDPASGVAVFVPPSSAPRLLRGTTRAIFGASDYQEAKNVATFGPSVMPNTSYRAARIRVVRGTTVTWLLPRHRGCVRGNQGLLVVANSTGAIWAVRFFDGKRPIKTVSKGVSGLYAATWRVRAAKRGLHKLRAVVASARGRNGAASRVVRLCK